MNSEYFIRFVKAFQVFDYLKENKPKLTLSMYGDGSIEKIDPKAERFRDNIKRGIAKSKVFEIEDNIKKLLCLTDTPIKNDEIKLPFNTIFLDVAFTKEELKGLGIEINAEEIIGIMANEGILTNGKIITGKDLNLVMMSLNDKGEVWFDDFNKNCNLNEEYKGFNVSILENPTTDKKAKDFIHKFFLNFLNFLNNPEVEYIEHKRSTKNIERRLKKRKPIIPSSFSIRINGKLKQYIDEITRGSQFHYNYRFWVRGHFRILSSERYIRKKRIWILPYIKGEGILIEKTYKLKQENDLQN